MQKCESRKHESTKTRKDMAMRQGNALFRAFVLSRFRDSYFRIGDLGLGICFAGLAAALILATAVHFTWLARIGRIDMPLSFAATIAIGSFHLASSSSRLAGFLLQVAGYLALAAGIMLKGPIGLILPVMVILA